MMLSDRFGSAVEAGKVAGSSELFREDWRIAELKVMLRPASALQAVGARMAVELTRGTA